MTPAFAERLATINSLIEQALGLARNTASDPQQLVTVMDKLTVEVDILKTQPEAEWQGGETDILHLTANLDRLQDQLAKSHEEAQLEMNKMQRLIKAQKSYARPLAQSSQSSKKSEK